MSGETVTNAAIAQTGAVQQGAEALGDRTDPEAIQQRNAAAMRIARLRQMANFGEGLFENEVGLTGLSTRALNAGK